MRKILLILPVLLLLVLAVGAQTTFIDRGKIYYERRVNQHALEESLRGDGPQSTFTEEIRKMIPKILVNQYVLSFNAKHSFYKISDDDTERKVLLQQLKPEEDDFKYQQFSEGYQITSRTFFEHYLLKDSMKAHQWKFTGETREIAGFECKKALTTICDSVVVVAFYTDEITVAGGPERFHGLPGMILGIAVPRLYLTLFATKIELTEPVIKLPVKPGAKFSERVKMDADLNKLSYMSDRSRAFTRWMQAL